MPTYKEFIDDIAVAMGLIHDDAVWSIDNLLMNVIFCENLLVKQQLSKDLGLNGDGISGTHKREIVCVPLTHVECDEECSWEHAYFDLPSEVYDLPFDGGVSMIRYANGCGCPPAIMGASFTSTSLERLSSLRLTSYQSPREDRPYFARYTTSIGADRVGVFGVSTIISKLLVGVYYAPRFETMPLSATMRIDPDRLFDLKRLVLTMSAWPLGIPQERLKNDGRDFEPGQVVLPRPLLSINDPILTANNEN